VSQTATEQKFTPAQRLGGIVNSYVVASAVSAVIRLDIPDIIGDGEVGIDELAKQTETNNDALYRVMRLLASMEIFEETKDRVFANSEASQSIRSDVADSQRAMIEFITDPMHFELYADMLPTIKDGRPSSEHRFKKNIFDLFEETPDEQRRFNDAMTNLSKNAIKGVLEAYDFSGIETLVDVAGGHAVLLTSILQKYSSMKGILFDLEHVVPGAQQRIKELELTDRCSTEYGDFFKKVPTGDAYIMKHIIHDWDDEHSLKILKNCHAAMAKSGARKLLLVEMILSGRNVMHPSKFLDIEMLMLPGGRERTEEEYKALLLKAGFTLSRVVTTKGPNTVIEAIPIP
jgi:hypothetical protein